MSAFWEPSTVLLMNAVCFRSRYCLGAVIGVLTFAAAGACSKKPPPAATTTTTTAVPVPPAALGAIREIYGAYVSAPATFERLPHLSRFFIEHNQGKDAACANGGAKCEGDRFACLVNIPAGRGQVIDVKADGEQPGLSATVRLRLRFGDEEAAADVDAVWEDGQWKIDQVRCGGTN